jgi:hypothetical protein
MSTSVGVTAIAEHRRYKGPGVKVIDVGRANAELHQALIEGFRKGQIGVPLRKHEMRLLDHVPA